MKLVKYALIALSILTVSFVALSFYVTEQMMRPAFYALRTPAQGLIPRDGSTDPLQDFNIPFESVEFPAVDRQTLRGWFVPGNTDAAAAIITVHGGGTDRRSYLDMVPVLHEAGYPVLLFYNREHGISDGQRPRHESRHARIGRRFERGRLLVNTKLFKVWRNRKFPRRHQRNRGGSA